MQADSALANSIPRNLRPTHNKRHLIHFFESGNILEEQPVRSQQIPVVGAHYNDRVVEFAHPCEKVNHPPELGIYFANRREITRPRCTLVLLVELTPNALRPPIKPRPVRQIIIGIGRRWQLLLCIRS